MSRLALIALLFLALNATALPRDRTQVNAFKRENPCPATGMTKGACPGYEIDHIKPLKCRGRDRPSNMQWLTVAAHKLKTKKEIHACRKKR